MILNDVKSLFFLLWDLSLLIYYLLKKKKKFYLKRKMSSEVIPTKIFKNC